MALLSRAVLAKALWDKTTPQYKDKPIWGAYSYDRDIYLQARLAFPEYAKLYPTNEEFTKYFVRDLNNKNPKLLQKLTAGVVTKEDQALIDQFNQATAEQVTVESPPTEVTPAETSTAVATGGTTGGMGMPGVPVASSARRVYVVQQTPLPKGGMEGGTGQGTAATAKIDRLRTGATKATVSAPQEKIPSGAPLVQRVNLQGFKLPPSFLNTAKNFGSGSQIFAKRNLGKVFEGLKGIGAGLGRGVLGPAAGGLYSVGGRLGNGALNAVGRVSRPGGLGGGGMRNLSRSSNKLAFGLIGLMLFMVILGGVLGGIGGTTPGEAAPLPGTADISSCKFTRAGNSQTIKSSILIGWITNAALAAGVPPQTMASIAMHENQDFTANADNSHDAIKSNQFCNKGNIFCEKSGQVLHSIEGKDDPCTADEIAAGAKTAQAVGLMQNIDIYNPGVDLCRITQSLSIAASKLKADGMSSQPTQDQVFKAIRAYYNDCDYTSGGKTYSYCNEVWLDLQNCQTSPAPAPVPSGDLHQAIIEKFRINMDPSLDQQHLAWAWQILADSEAKAPKFFPLLREKYDLISVIVWSGMGQRIGNTIYLSNAPGTFFAAGGESEFKQILIHELGHIIHGVRSDARYTAQIENAKATDKDFLTGYAQGATANPTVVCEKSDSDETAVQLDEDFAESIAYYINKNTFELNYSNKCPPKNPGQNPFRTGKYPNHLKLMQEVLGGTF